MKTPSLRIYFWFVIIIGFCFPIKAQTLSTSGSISGAPNYIWYNGCVPTSAGAILGYWDLNGCPNLFNAKGSAVYVQANVDNQICSPTYIANNYSLVPPYTSIAEFCQTSGSGATSSANIVPGITGYLNYRGSVFSTTSVPYSITKSGSNLWTKLVNEINAGRPMLFAVDDGNGKQVNSYTSVDHAVAVIGYCTNYSGSGEYYECYTTGSTQGVAYPPVWEKFQYYSTNGTNASNGNDVYYGVSGGYALDPTELTFSSTGLTTWPGNYTMPLTNSMSMSVTSSPGFQATIPGSISGTGSLTLVGGGELILSGSNTYTGGTFVDDGTLIINSASSLPSGSSLTIGAGGTMIFDTSVTGSPAMASSYEIKPSSNTESVPEPSTMILVLASVPFILLFFKRRKHKLIL